MFNKYMWNLYLQSGGNNVVDMFRRNLADHLTEEYAEKVADMRQYYCINADAGRVIEIQIRDLIQTYEDIEKELGEEAEEDEKIDTEEIPKTYVPVMDSLYETLGLECGTSQRIFDEFSGGMVYYSTNLSVLFPTLFVPYYFQHNYNVLQFIADEFEIELPHVPAKKDYKGRFYFYGEISCTLLNFAKQNELSIYELYAFMYDFAPHYIGGTDSYVVKDLPSPRSAFFIGADSSDQFLADNKSEIVSWQCNPDTRVGDMIVMYMRTPISAVESIWRACSVGFIDPFFYYYRCVYISNPIEINKSSNLSK